MDLGHKNDRKRVNGAKGGRMQVNGKKKFNKRV
jgi:hypothetical protein